MRIASRVARGGATNFAPQCTGYTRSTRSVDTQASAATYELISNTYYGVAANWNNRSRLVGKSADRPACRPGEIASEGEDRDA